MQTIKRKYLQEIYPKVCKDWQAKIHDLILWNTKETIEVSDELINEAFEGADTEQKKFLLKHFKILSNNLLDDITNFQDILKVYKKFFILPYQNPISSNQIKINALAKLQIIEEVLNEEETIKWLDWSNHNQYKYYNWFKNEIRGGWVFLADDFRVSASFGEVAFYKNSKLAQFAGKTFLKEYKEYITGVIES